MPIMFAPQAPNPLHDAMMNFSAAGGDALGRRLSPQGRAMAAFTGDPGRWLNEQGELSRHAPGRAKRNARQNDYMSYQDDQGNWNLGFADAPNLPQGAQPLSVEGRDSIVGQMFQNLFGGGGSPSQGNGVPQRNPEPQFNSMSDPFGSGPYAAQFQAPQQNRPFWEMFQPQSMGRSSMPDVTGTQMDPATMLQQMFMQSIGQGPQQIGPGLGGPMLPHREEGGPVDKPSRKELQDFLAVLNADRGGIPMIAHPGEFVLNADAVSQIGEDRLEDLNNQARSGLPHMQTGGGVPSNTTAQFSGVGSGGQRRNLTEEELQALVEQDTRRWLMEAEQRNAQAVSPSPETREDAQAVRDADIRALGQQGSGIPQTQEHNPNNRQIDLGAVDAISQLLTANMGHIPGVAMGTRPAQSSATYTDTPYPPEFSHRQMRDVEPRDRGEGQGDAPSTPEPIVNPIVEFVKQKDQTEPTEKRGKSKVGGTQRSTKPPTPETEGAEGGVQMPHNVPNGQRVDIDWQAVESMTPGQARDYFEAVARAESGMQMYEAMGLEPGQRGIQNQLLDQYRTIGQEQGQQLNNIYGTNTMDSRVQQQQNAANQGTMQNHLMANTFGAAAEQPYLQNQAMRQEMNQSAKSFPLRQDILEAQAEQYRNAQTGNSPMDVLGSLGLDLGQLLQMQMQGANYRSLMQDRTISALEQQASNDDAPEEQRQLAQATLLFMNNPQMRQVPISEENLEQFGFEGSGNLFNRGRSEESLQVLQQAKSNANAILGDMQSSSGFLDQLSAMMGLNNNQQVGSANRSNVIEQNRQWLTD